VVATEGKGNLAPLTGRFGSSDIGTRRRHEGIHITGVGIRIGRAIVGRRGSDNDIVVSFFHLLALLGGRKCGESKVVVRHRIHVVCLFVLRLCVYVGVFAVVVTVVVVGFL